MAEIIPDEGLDYLVNLALKNGTPPATLYVGLFIGGTATTVPASTATLAAMGGSFAEAAFTGYARQSIAAAAWGATGVLLSGRGSTGPQVSHTAGAAYATAINGYFLATVSSGTSGVVLGYSNFDEGTVASLSLNDVIKTTPRWALTG